MDEAKKKGINIDLETLSNELKIPVIGCSAVNNEGINDLKETIRNYKKRTLLKSSNIDVIDNINRCIMLTNKVDIMKLHFFSNSDCRMYLHPTSSNPPPNNIMGIKKTIAYSGATLLYPDIKHWGKMDKTPKIATIKYEKTLCLKSKTLAIHSLKLLVWLLFLNDMNEAMVGDQPPNKYGTNNK